jgi:methylmalonyl-CoA mutase cobalamin-binding subunit
VTTTATPRPRRKSIVVLASETRTGEGAAAALVDSLSRFGFDVRYVGREGSPQRLAAEVAATRADAVELCIAQAVPVELIRDLLRELAAVGRSDARIVLHRVA